MNGTSAAVKRRRFGGRKGRWPGRPPPGCRPPHPQSRCSEKSGWNDVSFRVIMYLASMAAMVKTPNTGPCRPVFHRRDKVLAGVVAPVNWSARTATAHDGTAKIWLPGQNDKRLAYLWCNRSLRSCQGFGLYTSKRTLPGEAQRNRPSSSAPGGRRGPERHGRALPNTPIHALRRHASGEDEEREGER